MQNIHIQVNDGYFEKFLNLLDALPKNEIKIIDKEFQNNQKMLQKVLEDYKSGREKVIPYDEGMDEIDSWLDTLVKNENS